MSRTQLQLSDQALSRFLALHKLPPAFRTTAEQFYLPLAARLPALLPPDRPLLLGINGAQGTGKSTLAEFLDMVSTECFGWRNAILSIDDFYLTQAERAARADNVHPLLATRGVPGTHDTGLLTDVLDQLMNLPPGASAQVPRFDKANDDRSPNASTIEGPLDMIILEGWCVGSRAQDEAALHESVNDLERDEDPDSKWRTFVNDTLAKNYEPVFERLDALFFLQAPSFDAVFRWRLEQEQKLADACDADAASIMNPEQVGRFIRYYERLTRHNLQTLPSRADVVLTLDEEHAVVASDWRR